MFTFLKAFLNRGAVTLLSYVGWQIPASRVRRLVNISLIVITTFLTLSALL